MLAAVAFHDQASRQTGEIHDERPDRDLPPKPRPELIAAQALPEMELGMGGVGAHAPREVVARHDHDRTTPPRAASRPRSA